MEQELKERLEEATKKNEIDPPKKKKGCTSCKKKKHDVILERVVDEEIYVPTEADIKLAFAELTSLLGVKDDKKEFIGKIYKYIFNEEFDWNCRACVNNQARRFRIHLTGK
jgi:hypothetical protein